MKIRARELGTLTSVALFVVVLTYLAANAGRPSGMSESAIETWIPQATTRAALLVFETTASSSSPDDNSGLQVEKSVLIGNPVASSEGLLSLFIPAQVKQQLLVRTRDGAYYSSYYVWKDDPVLLNCRENPEQCSNFDAANLISSEQAQALLAHSTASNSRVFRQFFGSAVDMHSER